MLFTLSLTYSFVWHPFFVYMLNVAIKRLTLKKKSNRIHTFLKGPWDHKDILACGRDHVSSAQLMGQAPRWIPEASPGQLPPLLDTVLGSHPSSHSQSYGFSSSQVQI